VHRKTVKVAASRRQAFGGHGRHALMLCSSLMVLIWIKFVGGIWIDTAQSVKRRGTPMPADALLLSIFIISIFALFAGVMAWADYSTTTWQKNQSSKSKSNSLKKAA
jgi:hypothetical protein